MKHLGRNLRMHAPHIFFSQFARSRFVKDEVLLAILPFFVWHICPVLSLCSWYISCFGIAVALRFGLPWSFTRPLSGLPFSSLCLVKHWLSGHCCLLLSVHLTLDFKWRELHSSEVRPLAPFSHIFNPCPLAIFLYHARGPSVLCSVESGVPGSTTYDS